jgi:YidC/Oxa1 family membrane protein insertase
MQFPVLIGLFYVVQAPLKYMGFSPPPGASGDAPPPLSEYVVNPDAPGIQQALQGSDLANDLIHHALDVNRFLGLRLDCKPSSVLSGDHSGSVPVACGDGVLPFLPYALLIVLMGVTTWYQSKQMAGTRDSNNPQAQQMQLMGRIMPIMLMVFAFNFPTGVVLYWLTTNLWTIVQQRIVMAAVPPQTAPAGSGDGKAGKRAVAKAPQQGSKGSEAAPDGRARKASVRAASSTKKKKKR